MFPSKRPKTCRQYLSPGTDYDVPESTRRSRRQNPRNTGNVEQESDIQDEPNFVEQESVIQEGHERNVEQESDIQEGCEQGTAADVEQEGVVEVEPCSDLNKEGSFVSDSSNDNISTESEYSDDEEEGRAANHLQENEGFETEAGCEFLFEDYNNLSSAVEEPEETEVERREETEVEGREETEVGKEREKTKPKTDYAKKYQLYEMVGVIDVTKSKFEILLMIFHIILRHGMTGPFIEDMLHFFNEICGQQVVPATKYLFNQIFTQSLSVHFHYFCTSCNMYLGERQTFDKPVIKCPTCDTECNVTNVSGSNVFITLPLADQIENILQKPGIKIISNHSESPNYCDIRDGIFFKKLCESGRPLFDKDAICLIFNADGAAVFESGEYSLWPLWSMIANLDPTQRFLGENLILCGLWFGKKSPDFDFFLTPFIQELQRLAKPEHGITLKTSNGEIKKVSVVAPMCSVDSVAKPKLAKQKQFNGKFSCGYCHHPGNIVSGLKNVRFVVPETGEYPKRTCEQMRADMFKAHELELAGQLRKSKTTKDHVNGIMGVSPLLAVPLFNIVEGFVIDYMHAVLLGVTAKFIDLWNGKKECIVEGKSLALVDERLTNLKPPCNVQNPPMPLAKKSQYKAKDYRALLVFYMLPCLLGILKRPYYENLQMFVKAIYILLSDSITPEKLKKADFLLKEFVKNFNKLYGDENMVYNIHLCTHLVSCVKAWGPLWSYSAFGFESGNGDLLKLNTGTRGVASQICLKYRMVRCVKDYIERNSTVSVSPEVLDFCSSVIAFKYAEKSEEFDSGIRSFTSQIVRPTDGDERSLLTKCGLEPAKELSTFNRILKDRNVYCSAVYTKPVVFNDTCVRLKNGNYAIIKKIFKITADSNELWSFMNIIRIAAVEHLASHIKTCSKDLLEPLTMRKMSDVTTKCLLLTVEDVTYVCDFPNFFEKH